MDSMAKAKKSTNKRKATQASKSQSKTSRRSFMAMAPYIVGGVVVVGGIGIWGAKSVQASLAEQDTNIVGQGIPTIVQVHDATCSICVNLQRETRAALSTLDEDTINYRVANIASEAGLAFATQHGSSHATLLLFDGDGNLTRRMQGENFRNSLRAAFMAHIAAEN